MRLAIYLLAASAAWAQPAFEVASVKPSAPSEGDRLNINLGAVNHNTVTMANVTLSEAIRWAYHLVSQEQVTGPDWINDRSIRFDITAKAAAGAPAADLRSMMQTLLAERFALKVHTEPRRMDHYELAVDPKTGSKLTPAAGDQPAFRPEYAPGKLHYSHITANTIAVLLARQLKEMVLDNTNLPGFYDISLEWTPDDAGVSGVDVYSAVRQQLGLRLQHEKSQVNVYVVDHAEKTPAAN